MPWQQSLVMIWLSRYKTRSSIGWNAQNGNTSASDVLSCNLCWVSFVIFTECLRNVFTRVCTCQLCHNSSVSLGKASLEKLVWLKPYCTLICWCMCSFVCTFVYVCCYMCLYMFYCVYIYMYIWVYMCSCIYMCYVYVHVYKCTCDICVYMYVFVHLCIVCTCDCVYVCTCVMYT